MILKRSLIRLLLALFLAVSFANMAAAAEVCCMFKISGVWKLSVYLESSQEHRLVNLTSNDRITVKEALDIIAENIGEDRTNLLLGTKDFIMPEEDALYDQCQALADNHNYLQVSLKNKEQASPDKTCSEFELPALGSKLNEEQKNYLAKEIWDVLEEGSMVAVQLMSGDLHILAKVILPQKESGLFLLQVCPEEPTMENIHLLKMVKRDQILYK